MESFSNPAGKCLLRCGCLILALLTSSLHAVILFSTGDPEANTTAPTGELADSGWQYQGFWGGFLGTPISPRQFITARHVGGNVGDSFHFQGQAYVTRSFTDDPDSDLRIWNVCGTFPVFAPLSTLRLEIGRAVVVFGRGTQRGEPLLVEDVFKGWQWGPADGRLRWGENEVARLANSVATAFRDLLVMTFDAEGGMNEAHLSTGDSGGAVFLREGDIWKLAGINYAVDGPFNTIPSDPGFLAALFDSRSLYTKEEEGWVLAPVSDSPQPSAFYVTRLSTRLAWINSVLASAPSDDTSPTLLSAATMNGPFATEPEAIVQPETGTILLPRPVEIRFFRLTGCRGTRILDVKVEGEMLAIRYLLE